MKRFGIASTVGVAILLTALAGCIEGVATPLPPSKPSTVVSVDGTFRVSGGPHPGIDAPLSGTVTFEGPVTEKVSAADGLFTAGLPPGEYKATGQPEGHFATATCLSTTVTVAARHTERIKVVCIVE